MTKLDPRALRRAFGSFMTGVTVVTTRDAAGRPVGFTANSFTSVSLDPPTLLVCPGQHLSTYDSFASCTHFAVNVLSEGQEDVSNTFASCKDDRFARVPHVLDARGNALINGAAAQFSCRRVQSVPAGDHCILVGAVEVFSHADKRGLGYAGGRYFSLGLEREALAPPQAQSICGAIVELGDTVLLDRKDAGYRPLQVSGSDRGHLRPALSGALGERGIKVRLGAVYSVFDEPHLRSAYVLATALTAPADNSVEAVPVDRLPTLTYATRPIADMMTRFAFEHQTREFAFYLGDAQRGDIHLPL